MRAELAPELVAELEALAPAELVSGSWDDVRRRASLVSPRRRALTIAATALVTLVALGTAANAAFGWKVSPFWKWVNSYPPGRTSPIVTVFSGPRWSLVAWMSTNGLCLSYGAPGASSSGCEGTRPPAVDLAGFGKGSSASYAYGTVSASVARLSLRTANGKAVAVRLRAEPALRTGRRFFYVEFESNPGTLIARNARGQVVARRPV